MAAFRISITLHIFGALSLLALAATSTSSCTLAASTAGAICGVHGDVLLPPNIYKDGAGQIVDSYKSCLNLCARREPGDEKYCHTNAYGYPGFTYSLYDEELFCTTCAGFLYTEKTGLCQLVAENLGTDAFQERKSSPNTYTDLKCFDCLSGCDSPVGSQLLDNGDFSGQLLGPWDVSAGGALIPRRKGSNYFACDAAKGLALSVAPGDSGSVCQLQQSFNMCPDTLYSMQFDYRIPSVQNAPKRIFAGFDFAGFDLDYFPGAFGYSKTFGANVTQPWTTALVYFRSMDPANGPMRLARPLTFVFFDPDSATKMIYGVTNVIVKRLAPPRPKPGVQPLLMGHVNNNQSLVTKPGVSYLLSVAFSIPNTAVLPAIFITFTEGTQITAHYFEYTHSNYGDPGSTEYKYSVPYRAETTRTQLLVAKKIVHVAGGDTLLTIHNITFIELAVA